MTLEELTNRLLELKRSEVTSDIERFVKGGGTLDDLSALLTVADSTYVVPAGDPRDVPIPSMTPARTKALTDRQGNPHDFADMILNWKDVAASLARQRPEWRAVGMALEARALAQADQSASAAATESTAEPQLVASPPPDLLATEEVEVTPSPDSDGQMFQEPKESEEDAVDDTTLTDRLREAMGQTSDDAQPKEE